MTLIQPPPEIDFDRLKELVAELRQAGALAGPLKVKRGRKPKGLAFVLADMNEDQIQQVLQRVDLTLRLSPQSLQTLNALRDLIAQNKILTELSVKDQLTTLYNYRYFLRQLEIEMERVKRTERPCSLLIIDLDHFKPVNDRFGHETGNQVLRSVAAVIRESARSVDIAVRYGGDEFAVIMPDTAAKQAFTLAERIRRGLLDESLIREYKVSGSFGLATYHYFDTVDLETFISHADKAMYLAKKEGGNRVSIWEADLLKEEPTEVTTAERDALFSSEK